MTKYRWVKINELGCIIDKSFCTYDSENECFAVMKRAALLGECLNVGRYDTFTIRIKDGEIEVENVFLVRYTYKIETIHSDCMDSSNGHDKELVARVNNLWDTEREKFMAILCTLMERDEEEFKEFDVEFGTAYDRVHSYLMNVADNKDLEVIVKFCE